MCDVERDVLCVKRGAVQAEVIDGEAVVINMETGKYFCLNGAGATIWQWLEQGAGAEAMVAALTAGNGAGTADARAALLGFLEALNKEELLAVHDGAGASCRLPSSPATAADLLSPDIEVFTDMQQFLLVDPVHEIDEDGIPRTS